MGWLTLFAAWASGVFLAYCLVAINPRDDD